MRWQRLPETVAVIDKSFVSKPEYCIDFPAPVARAKCRQILPFDGINKGLPANFAVKPSHCITPSAPNQQGRVAPSASRRIALPAFPFAAHIDAPMPR